MHENRRRGCGGFLLNGNSVSAYFCITSGLVTLPSSPLKWCWRLVPLTVLLARLFTALPPVLLSGTWSMAWGQNAMSGVLVDGRGEGGGGIYVKRDGEKK